MSKDLFGSLFEYQDSRLDDLGDPLPELDANIQWNGFRKALNRVHKKQRKGNAGAKPKDVVMMYKCLVIQSLYGLSDDQLEFQIEDRRSFRRFVGLGNHERAPDAKTFWAFRNRLSELGLVEKLFDQMSKQLNAAGFIAQKGQIIDASIVTAPVQHNKTAEKEQIENDEIPEDWSANKKAQKDVDARWFKKGKAGPSKFGYKNHIEIDNKNKLIRKYGVTSAGVHESNVFKELLDPDNTNADVYADRAYASKAKELLLASYGYRSRISKAGRRNHPLTEAQRRANKRKSQTRGRVEHVFGAQTDLRKKAIRSIGIVRAQTEIGLMNIVYNMRRLCFLSRVSAS